MNESSSIWEKKWLIGGKIVDLIRYKEWLDIRKGLALGFNGEGKNFFIYFISIYLLFILFFELDFGDIVRIIICFCYLEFNCVTDI